MSGSSLVGPQRCRSVTTVGHPLRLLDGAGGQRPRGIDPAVRTASEVPTGPSAPCCAPAGSTASGRRSERRWSGMGVATPLVTDLYEVTMALAYLKEGVTAPATFSLFARALPAERGFLVGAGLAQVVDALIAYRVDDQAVEGFAAALGRPTAEVAPLRGLEFTGDVDRQDPEVRAAGEGVGRPNVAHQGLKSRRARADLLHLDGGVVGGRRRVRSRPALRVMRELTTGGLGRSTRARPGPTLDPRPRCCACRVAAADRTTARRGLPRPAR